jgi:hypothetical protein
MTAQSRRHRGVAVSVVMLCAAGPALAADSGFYLGLDSGVALYPDHAAWRIDENTFTGTGTDVPVSRFTWDFSGGYRFNRYFSLAAGYVGLGERTSQVVDRSGAPGSTGQLSFTARGETLAAIGTVPFGKWAAWAQAGIMRDDVNINFSGSVAEGPLESSVQVIDFHPLVGLGLARNLDDRWSVRFGWNHYWHVGSTDRNDGFRINGPGINTLTLGAAFRF